MDPALQDHEIQPSDHTVHVMINVTQSLHLNHALGTHLLVIQNPQNVS
jgi:hypothetical protein